MSHHIRFLSSTVFTNFTFERLLSFMNKVSGPTNYFFGQHLIAIFIFERLLSFMNKYKICFQVILSKKILLTNSTNKCFQIFSKCFRFSLQDILAQKLLEFNKKRNLFNAAHAQVFLQKC